MYDSENIPLATRIQAGDGVTITHAVNSDGEAVWTARVDQAWLTTWVNANSSGALKLNDSDEARIRALENKLGIKTEDTTPPAPSVPSGTTGTTEVTAAADVATMTGTIVMTYNIVGIDGTALVSETMTGSSGTTPTQVLMAIYSQMKRNNAMLHFMTPTFDFTNSKLVLTWKSANVGSTFTYVVTSQGSGDNLRFTATDY